MPIYAYRCTECGHAQDVLQKMSDPLLSVCPACGAAAFSKQLTAAGFQLKGSGWYVTDFRDGKAGGAKKDDKAGDAPAGDADRKAEAQSDAKPDAKADSKPEAKTDAKPAADTSSKPADKPSAAPAAAAPPPASAA